SDNWRKPDSQASRSGRCATTVERTCPLCFAEPAIGCTGLDRKQPFCSRRSVDKSASATNGTSAHVRDHKGTSSSPVSISSSHSVPNREDSDKKAVVGVIGTARPEKGGLSRYNPRMRRLFAGLLCLPVLASAQTRPRKIFISADMEGITGVVQPAQLGPDGFEYQRAREWMTGEVSAAIAAIRESGPADIVVCDSHGNGQSLLIDKLPEDVQLVRGFPRPLEMM